MNIQLGGCLMHCGRCDNEITINYEAGAKARYEAWINSITQYPENQEPWLWEDLPLVPKTKFREDAKAAINAALNIQ